jgi:23S rRNA pseudouridine2604 synthase
VKLSDAMTKPCKIEKLGAKVFRITLTQGLNRQIRRMCAAFGFTVESLQRVRIMHIKLGQLPVGKWRNLSEPEIAALFTQKPRTQPPSPSPARPAPPRPPPRSFGQRRGRR